VSASIPLGLSLLFPAQFVSLSILIRFDGASLQARCLRLGKLAQGTCAPTIAALVEASRQVFDEHDAGRLDSSTLWLLGVEPWKNGQ
jgi:hypothetical protein